MTNCKNCGAPLVNGKCEYCETEYDRRDDGITLPLDLRIINGKIIDIAIMTPNEVREMVDLERL